MAKRARSSLFVLFLWLVVVGIPLSLSAAAMKENSSPTDGIKKSRILDNAKVSANAELRDHMQTPDEKDTGTEEFTIKPGDILTIAVEGYEEDYNQTVVVQQDGRMKYKSLGEIKAAGLTVPQLEEEIKELLRIYVSNPQVEVSVWQKEYVIQPGDILDIAVEEHEEYNQKLAVQEDGKIKYKSLGKIQAAGLTAPQLEEELKQVLKPQISDPQVTISVEEAVTREEVLEVEPAEAEVPTEPEEKVVKPEPEEEEYLISPGDVIDIVVMEHGDYTRVVAVQADGSINYPPLGEIPAAGFTEERLSQEIAAGLRRYISDPRVRAVITGIVDQTFPKSLIKKDLIDEQADELTDEETGELEEYLIKPRDVVNIIVEGRDNYNQTAVVQMNGKALYSPLGEVRAAGLTASQLADSISLGLSTRIHDPKVMVYVGQFRELSDDIHRVEIPIPAPLKRFGYDFFAGGRRRILKQEESLTEGARVPSTPSVVRDAISGFVGPLDMMGASVSATVPAKYVLGPGDRLMLTFWSDVVERQTVPLIVDDEGEVTIPRVGGMVVRGMTLAQFQEAAKAELTRAAYKDLELIASLDKLRSIQIFITGEAFRPGSYAVSAVTTLFNALYMCGGPTDSGSLREIKLLRGDETKPVDFYKFLIDGDSSQNFNLDAGDTILIPQAGRLAAIFGEVNRPAIYELKEGEGLSELISLAGGIRPSGFLQRVQIDSVDPGKERTVIDVDISEPDGPDLPIFDGDFVKVFSIPSERMNTVSLEGKVRMSGVYQLKEGMNVSDLIKAARGLMGEAYMERADLLRLNPDEKTTKLIPINLRNALAGDAASNLSLRQWDKLIVYSKWDVKWVADRVVSIHGAVQRPGSYEKPDGMTVGDLVMKAGGVLPDAYPDRALLMRLDQRGEATKAIAIALEDSGSDLKLEDGDTLIVYTYREVRWEPTREVAIEGAVQSPCILARFDDMKVSDLIKGSGGLLPDAYPDRALLLRLDERQRVTQGFFISPKLALQGDPQNDLTLQDGDNLIVYTYEEAVWEPKREVTVEGAVLNPDTFERVDGMRISDLVRRAGGVLPYAYQERADINRYIPEQDRYITVPVNLVRALLGDEEADVILQDEDQLTIYTLSEVQYRPENVVVISGMVQRPGIYVRTIGMKLSDLLFASGGILPGAHRNVEIARIDRDGQTLVLTMDVIALTEGDESQDLILEDGDVVSVREQREFQDTLRTATVQGAVKYPGNYALKQGETLSNLIQRAGGLTDRAYPEAAVITREINYLVLEEQRRSMRQVKRLFEMLNEMEYWRELAGAELARRRSGLGGEELQTASGAQPVLSTGASIPVLGTMQEAAEVAAITSIPGQAEVAISSIEEISRPQYTMVTPARKIDSFLPSGRLLVDLKRAVEKPGAKDDITVQDGDVIIIPDMPAVVSVSGAVIQPSSLIYIEGNNAKDYIKMAGGYTRDADVEAVYVVKANGMVISGDKSDITPGDVIVVPTKVMVQKVTDRWGQVIGVVKFAVTTLATVYTIKLILGQI